MRHKWILVAVPVVVVLGTATGLAVVAVDYVKNFDIEGKTITDPRSCEESKVSLKDSSRHFKIELPADASEVRFHSTIRPLFGEQDLRLSFRTSGNGLQAFLKDGGFGRPLPGAEHTGKASLGSQICGVYVQASFKKPYSTTHSRLWGQTGQTQRDVIVDLADRAHPRVVLLAGDIEGNG